MADVAVLHNTLDFQGGADTVCLAVCDALADDHDVTLFTVSETALEALSDRFDTPLPDVDVRMPTGANRTARALSWLAPWVGPQLAFRSVLLRRFFLPVADEFDLAVSTANEVAVPIPSVQYVHYPQFKIRRAADADAGRLNALWSRVAAPDVSGGTDTATYLANSGWTADVFEAIYGTRPTVLHPPVDPISCDTTWEDRETGIVVVGRIAPDKRLEEAIAIVDGVRDRGHDVHLHIVGSAPRAYRRYADRIAAAAEERPYVHLETDVPRRRVIELLCGYRYGLNVKADEHFGMAVAEYVAAGMVPFAPASGGQREILRGRADRSFDSVPEAIDLVSGAIDRDDRPRLQRDRFATDGFQEAFRQHVR
ncbi:Glycosyltransferase [Halanaeroarchaeum sp. HSR-CO]|uniref:glycosyltransferase n=1 Tax=Halanaeroarchaeum sp. HSR-CO TaxID=2866382 RepID=UPI00217DA274|nr:glycosyltransferase [Halanaeroarchaeum sp. HSR-CO]UWG48383.1 Glycosyltransferase [Halanaeroarchaeum sp. HSR-CO]